MKTVPVLSAALLLSGSLLPSALGQAPRAHSLSLNAVATAAGGSTQLGEKTHGVATEGAREHGGLGRSLTTTQTQTTSSSEAVNISVRNFAALPDSAHVEWYFVAQPVKLEPGKPVAEQQFVFDQGVKDISLAPNGTETFNVESKEITSSVARKDQARTGRYGKVHVNRKSLGEQQTGNKLDGWMVRVVADGKVVATKGSSSTLEDIAKDDAKLKALASE